LFCFVFCLVDFSAPAAENKYSQMDVDDPSDANENDDGDTVDEENFEVEIEDAPAPSVEQDRLQTEEEIEEEIEESSSFEEEDAEDGLALTILLQLLESQSYRRAPQVSLDDFLRIVKQPGVAHPDLAAQLPSSYQQAMKKIAPLLAQCTRYDVCRCESFLWRSPRSPGDSCPNCRASRLDPRGRPWMTFRHLPLAARLKRLFESQVTQDMSRFFFLCSAYLLSCFLAL
jgi:hypothetical protein